MTNKILSTYTQACVFLFFTSALIVPSGYTYGTSLLLLASLPHVLIKKTYRNIDKQSIWFISALLLYAAVGYFEVVFFNLDPKKLEKPSFFIGAAIALLYLKKHPPKQKVIWLSLSIGGLITGLFAIYFKFSVGLTRIGVHNNPIQYGNISMLLGLLSFCGIIWAWQQNRKYLWVTLLFLGFVFGLTASLLSGSRGGWIALPTTLTYIILHYRKALGYKKIGLLLAIVLMFITFTYNLESTGVKHRIIQAVNNLKHYEQGYTYTSIGVRLELWKTLFKMFKEKPIAGWGEENYYIQLGKLVQKEATTLKHIYHPHSDILYALSHRGLIGISALALLYLIPIISFRSARKDGTMAQPISIAGITLILCYMDFGLADMFINKRNGILYFLFPLVVLFSCRQAKPKHSDLEHA